MSGADCVHGFVITTEPPYGQSENGNGGPSTGEGVLRNAGGGEESDEGCGFQSSAYALINRVKKLLDCVCEEAATAGALTEVFPESPADATLEPSAGACAQTK
jgi:hypothetical protein